MELVAVGLAIETGFVGWFFGRNPTEAQPVKDQRIVQLFEQMKFRMGMDQESIYLRETDNLTTAYATGLICCGLSGQVTFSKKWIEGKSDAEISAVFAHELSHLKHYDVIRFNLVLFTTQLVIAVALSVLFSISLPVCLMLGFVAGYLMTFLGFSHYMEFHAEEETAKVLDNAELLHYINYHGGGLEDHSNWSHPNSIRVVKMLRQELNSRAV